MKSELYSSGEMFRSLIYSKDTEFQRGATQIYILIRFRFPFETQMIQIELVVHHNNGFDNRLKSASQTFQASFGQSPLRNENNNKTGSC